LKSNQRAERRTSADTAGLARFPREQGHLTVTNAVPATPCAGDKNVDHLNFADVYVRLNN